MVRESACSLAQGGYATFDEDLHGHDLLPLGGEKTKVEGEVVVAASASRTGVILILGIALTRWDSPLLGQYP